MNLRPVSIFIIIFVIALFPPPLYQDNCAGRHLPHSGLHDVEIYQLSAAPVERACPSSDLEKETSSFQEQIEERQR